MWFRLKNFYKNDEMLGADLRNCYNIIKPGSYFIDKCNVVFFVIFIMKLICDINN